MSRHKKILATIALVTMIANTKVFATENTPPNVRLVGDANGIVFIPGDSTFLSKGMMLPGDKVARTMEIENNYDVPYQLYMKAERITPEEEYDLLNILKLKITHNDKVIYEGKASGENGLTSNIDLGTYNPGEKGELIAEVILDGATTGNEYNNKKGEVVWIFTATNNRKSEEGNPSKTGDSRDILSYSILACGSLLLGISIIASKRKKKEVE